MKNGMRLTVSGALITLAVVIATMMAVSRGAAAPDERAANEKALREADSEWSKAASAGDLDRTLSFYADDATLLPPNAPMVTGKEALRRVWKDVLAGFGKTLHWQATKVEVSRSGDLGTRSALMRVLGRRPRAKP